MLNKTLFCFAALLFTGCAASSDYMRPNAAGMANPTNAEVARVVFVRPSSFALAVVVTIIDHEGNFIGDSPAESHFAAELEPGDYTFIAWGEGTHSLRASLAPGKTYYAEVAPNLGWWSPRFHLKAIKESTAQWNELQNWLAQTTYHDILRAEGQAEVDRREVDAYDAITKGLARFVEYTPEEADERTLAAGDGI